MSDFTKTDYLNMWGETGYIETWCGHKYNWSSEIKELVKAQIGDNKDKVTLEIGCGKGYFTDFLAENSKSVFAIDLIPRPDFKSQNITYIENSDRQFNCASIEDESIDFVFSFGVFCHFSKAACKSYLKDIFRVLKKGGSGIMMFSDDAGLEKFYGQKTKAAVIYGEHNDYSDIMPIISKFDKTAKKILDFRDALVLIRKYE